jgi:hypothetical protein
MTITAEQILAVCAAGSTIATAIFWGAYYLGKVTNRIERLEERVDDHDRIIHHTGAH